MSREYKAEQCSETREEDEGLSALGIKALKKVAKGKGVSIKGLKTKEDIVEAINDAEEEAEAEEEEGE